MNCFCSSPLIDCLFDLICCQCCACWPLCIWPLCCTTCQAYQALRLSCPCRCSCEIIDAAWSSAVTMYVDVWISINVNVYMCSYAEARRRGCDLFANQNPNATPLLYPYRSLSAVLSVWPQTTQKAGYAVTRTRPVIIRRNPYMKKSALHHETFVSLHFNIWKTKNPKKTKKLSENIPEMNSGIDTPT